MESRRCSTPSRAGTTLDLIRNVRRAPDSPDPSTRHNLEELGSTAAGAYAGPARDGGLFRDLAGEPRLEAGRVGHQRGVEVHRVFLAEGTYRLAPLGPEGCEIYERLDVGVRQRNQRRQVGRRATV